MSTTSRPQAIGPQGPGIDPRLLARPDALQTDRGPGGMYGPGTPLPSQTYSHPGANAIQNLLLALEEGLTIPPSVFGVEGGTPEKFWDPRLLGLLAGTIAVIEPGPGGEGKMAGKGIHDVGSSLFKEAGIIAKEDIPKISEKLKKFGKGVIFDEGEEDPVRLINQYGQTLWRGRSYSGLRNHLADTWHNVHNVVEDIDEKIVGNAIKLKDGRIIAGPHPSPVDILSEAVDRGAINLKDIQNVDVTTGFITNTGRFVDEVEAVGVAKRSGQAPNPSGRWIPPGGYEPIPILDPEELSYPLPWHEWNQGRSLYDIRKGMVDDPEIIRDLILGSTEINEALSRADPYEIEFLLHDLADLYNFAVSPAAGPGVEQSFVEALRSGLGKSSAEISRRVLLPAAAKDPELAQSMALDVLAHGGFGNVIYDPEVYTNIVPKFLQESLADAQTSAVFAELLRNVGR